MIFLPVGLVKVFFLSFFFFILFISVGWGGGARHNSTISGPKSHLLKKETEPTLGPCACISLYKRFNYLIKAADPMDLHTKSLAELARKLAAKTQKKICIYGPFTVVTPWVCVAESKQWGFQTLMAMERVCVNSRLKTCSSVFLSVAIIRASRRPCSARSQD